MCDCKYGQETILKAPSWSHKETIGVDPCIAETIEKLWANGVVTLGCCCGHNKRNPSIVLDKSEPLAKVYDLLKSDGRDWDLFKWNEWSVAAWELVLQPKTNF